MYRHALPPGFVLKSQKKAMEAAAKADVISLEEFLEVEVWIFCSRPVIEPLIMRILPFQLVHVATQTGQEFNTSDTRNIREVETDATR